ncbi:MAG: thiamine pyrophosphate-binding protein [Desulfobacterales bacterium]|nr:thiamine pyrophosphate-binding protein [Desulfobacterales bacterium]
MSETNLAEAVIAYLCSKRVQHIFGIISHSSFSLTDAIAKHPQLRFIYTQHEGGAGNMALGYARAAGKPAVCLVSAGGGATNIVTATAQAYKESVPLFVISSEIDTASYVKGAWSSWHGIDQVRLFQPITKQSLKIERAEDLGSVLDALFCLMTRGRPGPVYLGIPTDVQAAALAAPLIFSETKHPAAPAIGSQDAETAVDLLLSAHAPVILAGTGVHGSGAQKEVQELAELLRLPVAVSYTAKGVFPESHPLALGCLGVGGRSYARKFFLESDLILALGTTFSEGTTLGFGHRTIPDQARIIQIDVDPNELGRNYPSHLAIQADVKGALQNIIAGVRIRKPAVASDNRRVQEIQDAKRAWQDERDLSVASQGMTKDRVLTTLSKLLDGKESLVTSGITGEVLRHIDAGSFLIHAGEFRAIGTAFATALGVKLGLPAARVVCVTGDGSFMMELQELATARLHNIPVLVIVLRNNAYDRMKRDQLKKYDGRVIGTNLFVPDLARLAGLFDARGFTVTRPDEIEPVFRQGLASDEFVIVDVHLDS